MSSPPRPQYPLIDEGWHVCKTSLEHIPLPRRGAVSAACRPPAVAAPPRRGRRVRSDPAPCYLARYGLTVRAPPHRRRVMMYPGPPRPGRRIITVRAPRGGCRPLAGPIPRKRRRVRSDPTSCQLARRGLTVRAPPHRRRVMVYPGLPRPGRRIITVRAPRGGCRPLAGPIPRKRRRVRSDPTSCQLARCGLTARAPPHRRRIRTYPGPPWPRRRVLIVRAPWSPSPRPPTPPTSCPRHRVPLAPIADLPPGHAQPSSRHPPRRPTTRMAGHIPPRRCHS